MSFSPAQVPQRPVVPPRAQNPSDPHPLTKGNVTAMHQTMPHPANLHDIHLAPRDMRASQVLPLQRLCLVQRLSVKQWLPVLVPSAQ